jgi:hypothetical protein
LQQYRDVVKGFAGVKCAAMRVFVLLTLVVFIAGCRGTQPYTAEDLHQVKAAYADIGPLYAGFKKAFAQGDAAGILHGYAQEQSDCRLVDEIDKRDTIDPNTNLFMASAGLDWMCDSIEEAYTYWAKRHGYPYDKHLTTDRPQDIFTGTDKSYVLMNDWLRHPSSLA